MLRSWAAEASQVGVLLPYCLCPLAAGVLMLSGIEPLCSQRIETSGFGVGCDSSAVCQGATSTLILEATFQKDVKFV